jgi:hypothetical protein
VFTATMTVRLKEINNEIVKASEAEVVRLFNPLRSGMQIKDELNISYHIIFNISVSKNIPELQHMRSLLV